MALLLLAAVRAEREEFAHKHFCGEQNIFALVVKGSFVYSCEGVEQETVTELEAVCFEKGVKYRRHVTSPLVLYLFRFKSDDIVLPRHKLTFRDEARIFSTISLLESLEKHISPVEFSYKRHLFADIVNQYRMENSLPLQKTEERDELIVKATRHMQRHMGEAISLPDIASMVGLSYVQFSRRFRVALGVTPFDYLAALRIRKAKQMLMDTELPLRVIAAECGFASEYYFSNFFKKHCEMSPTAFRKSLM